jgi:hypothetical protein
MLSGDSGFTHSVASKELYFVFISPKKLETRCDHPPSCHVPRLCRVMVTPVRALQKTLSVRLYSMSRLIAARFPDDALDPLLTVGAQVFSKARGNCNHLYLQRLDPEGPIVPWTGNIEAEFIPRYTPDSLNLLTNWNAPNRRVIQMDLASPSLEASREIVPEGDARIESVSTIGGPNRSELSGKRSL